MKVVGYAGSRSAFSKSICLGEKLKTMLREKNIEMELYTARNNVVEECRGWIEAGRSNLSHAGCINGVIIVKRMVQ